MILHLFTLLFVALKLTGVIDWSWFFVLLPSLSLFGILAFLGLVAVVIAMLKT